MTSVRHSPEVEKKILKKKARYLFLATGLFVLIGALISQFIGEGQSLEKLTIEREYMVDLPEISGLALVPSTDPVGPSEVIAVSDKVADLALLKFEKNDNLQVEIKSFFDLMRDTIPLCKAGATDACKKLYKQLSGQWEAVAFDIDDSPVLMQEFSGAAMVLAKDYEKITRVINFDFSQLLLKNANHKNKSAQKKGAKDNALGEGLIVLDKNRFFIAKERNAAAIIEFGVSGETALGFAGTLTKNAGASAAVESNTLVPLATWFLPGHYKECDISEISTDLGRQRLFLLSQKCQMISEILALKPGQPTIDLGKSWRLPRQIVTPEGLAVMPDGRFLVGSDIQRYKSRPSLFLLTAPR